jgi:hypothetical protein
MMSSATPLADQLGGDEVLASGAGAEPKIAACTACETRA